MTPATIIYVTNRVDPKFKWFVDGLCAQANEEQRRSLQVVFIDGHLWADDVRAMPGLQKITLASSENHSRERRVELEQIVNNRFDYLHIPPKPCVYQGPFRLTKKDWFCASNTRNTGFIVAKHGYAAFIDDLTVLGPVWLDQVLHAADHGYVVAGMYKKVRRLQVTDGFPTSFDEFDAGIDSRWPYGSSQGIVNWTGSIYGCSFGVPLELALSVDGFEMACCGAGGEDYDFTIRLKRAGAKIMLNRNMFTMESEEGHHVEGFKHVANRDRRLVSRDRLPSGYDSYQMPNKEEKYMSDHVLLNRACNESRVTPIMPENLRGIRQGYLENGMVPIPTEPKEDWRDGTPLANL